MACYALSFYREQQMLGLLLQAGKLSDSTKSVLSTILKTQPTITRFHPLLQSKASGKDYIDLASRPAENFMVLADKHVIQIAKDGKADRSVSDMLLLAFDPNTSQGKHLVRQGLRAFQQQLSSVGSSLSLLLLPLLNAGQINCADSSQQSCPSLSTEEIKGMRIASVVSVATEYMRDHRSVEIVNSTIDCLLSVVDSPNDVQTCWSAGSADMLSSLRDVDQVRDLLRC